MAWALQLLRVGVPNGHVAAGMRAYRRISDHAFGGALFCCGIEAFGAEAKQHDLVEPRAAAHGAARRIHWPRHHLLAAALQVVGRQRLRGGGSDRDQQIALSRPFACRIGLRPGPAGGERETDAHSERRPAPYPAGSALELPVHPFLTYARQQPSAAAGIEHSPTDLPRLPSAAAIVSHGPRRSTMRSAKPTNPRRSDAADDGSLVNPWPRPASRSCRRSRDGWLRHGLFALAT